MNEPYTRLPAPMQGHVTSSYWSATLGRSIAMALVKGGLSRMGETIYAPLADGRMVSARISSTMFYDPKVSGSMAGHEAHSPLYAQTLEAVAEVPVNAQLLLAERELRAHINCAVMPATSL